MLAEAEVIFGFVSPQYIIPRAPKLKWIQVATAGVERLLDAQMIESPMILTNVSGIHATVSGTMEDYIMRATEVFLENLRRYLSGKRLLNVVNKKKGY